MLKHLLKTFIQDKVLINNSDKSIFVVAKQNDKEINIIGLNPGAQVSLEYLFHVIKHLNLDIKKC